MIFWDPLRSHWSGIHIERQILTVLTFLCEQALVKFIQDLFPAAEGVGYLTPQFRNSHVSLLSFHQVMGNDQRTE